MSAVVVSQKDWFSWSLNQLSREFCIARETVQRRLREADVKPSGERRGYPVYPVGQAAKAILMPDSQSRGVNDPDSMTPKERADWFKSENDRIKFERESGISVVATEARTEMAKIAQTGLQVIETLPDVLERDFNLEPELIDDIERRIDALREQWAGMLEDS